MNKAEKAAELLRIIESAKTKNVEMEKVREEDGMRIRMHVLHASLYTEPKVHKILMEFLGVENERLIDLTFDRQIKFLQGIGVVTKEDSDFLDAFRLIRNKFIHHLEFKTYEQFYAKHAGQLELITKLINAEKKRLDIKLRGTREQELEFGTRLLFDKVTSICNDLDDAVMSRFNRDLIKEVYQKTGQRFQKEAGKPFNIAMDRIKNGVKETYSKEEVIATIQGTFTEVGEFYNRIFEEVKGEVF